MSRKANEFPILGDVVTKKGLVPRATPYRVRRFWTGLAFISPWLFGFLTLTLGPMVLSFYYSFTDYNMIHAPHWVGTYNYQSLFTDPEFLTAFRNTLYVLFIMVPLNLLTALIYGMLMNLAARGQSFYRTILYLPSLLPAVASAILWRWLYDPNFGLFNYGLSLIGIKSPLWLVDPHWAKPALLIVGLWGAGNSAVLFLAALRGVPRELYEAAMVDGAGVWWRFARITVPQISPVIFFNLVTGMIGGIQYFSQGFVMIGSTIQFWMTYIYNSAFVNLEMGFSSAASWVLLLFTSILVAIVFASQRWWVHYDE